MQTVDPYSVINQSIVVHRTRASLVPRCGGEGGGEGEERLGLGTRLGKSILTEATLQITNHDFMLTQPATQHLEGCSDQELQVVSTHYNADNSNSCTSNPLP